MQSVLWYPRPLIRELSPAFAQHLIRLHAHLFIHVAVMRIYLCTWPPCASIYARGRHCKQVLASVAAHQAAGIHSIPVAIIRSGDYNATVQGSVNKTKQNKTKQFNFDSRSN
jgi:hypothetical protein